MSYQDICKELFEKAVPKFDDCLIWQGPVDDRGEGHIKVGGKKFRVHKFVALYHVARPDEAVLRLKKQPLNWTCGHHVCINPQHLQFGLRPTKVFEELVHWWES